MSNPPLLFGSLLLCWSSLYVWRGFLLVCSLFWLWSRNSQSSDWKTWIRISPAISSVVVWSRIIRSLMCPSCIRNQVRYIPNRFGPVSQQNCCGHSPKGLQNLVSMLCCVSVVIGRKIPQAVVWRHCTTQKRTVYSDNRIFTLRRIRVIKNGHLHS